KAVRRVARVARKGLRAIVSSPAVPLTHLARAILFLLVSAAVAGGCQPAHAPRESTSQSSDGLPRAVDAAAAAITADYLKAQIAKVSSDTFQGRAPATAGDRA